MKFSNSCLSENTQCQHQGNRDCACLASLILLPEIPGVSDIS